MGKLARARAGDTWTKRTDGPAGNTWGCRAIRGCHAG